MKTASKVFIIIGLVASIILIILGIVLATYEGGLGGVYIGYGIYSLITSIGSLSSLRSGSKTKVIVWGVLYIPVMLIASVFMFCTPESDLY